MKGIKEVFSLKYLRTINNQTEEKVLKYSFNNFYKAKEHLISHFLKGFEMGVVKSNINGSVFYAFLDEETKEIIY